MKTTCPPEPWRRRIAVVVLAAVVAVATLSAHHGKDGYDETPITLTGTVISSEWVNPHVAIVLEAKQADGSVRRWSIAGSPPNAMIRGKFSRDDLKAGTPLTVTGFPTADRTRLTARSITYPDGRTQTTSNEFFRRLDSSETPNLHAQRSSHIRRAPRAIGPMR